MKKLPAIVFVFFSSVNLTGQSLPADNHAPIFQHLEEVNALWESECPNLEIGTFSSEEERIAFHLHAVIDELTSSTPESLSTAQENARTKLLYDLSIYADKGIFPINTHSDSRLPIFVDDLGTHCAVGQMMACSGHDQLVEAINDQHRFDYLGEIHTPGVSEWADEHGFSLQELAWIQPTYAPATTVEPVGGGTNGPVKQFLYASQLDGLAFRGEFSELDSYPCANIGYYSQDQLHCVGDGLEGTVHHIETSEFGLMACGQFEVNGVDYPLATWDEVSGSWSFITIPDQQSVVAVFAEHLNTYNSSMIVTHQEGSESHILWKMDDQFLFEKLATFNGPVSTWRKAETWIISPHLLAGQFSEIIIHTGDADELLEVNNLVYVTTNGPTGSITTYDWEQFDDYDHLPDNILGIHEGANGTLFFYGESADEGPLLTRNLNDVNQPVVLAGVGQGGLYAQAIYDVNNVLWDSDLLIAGDLNVSPNSGNWGRNIGRYNLGANYILEYGGVDSTVHDMRFHDGYYFIGGDFMGEVPDGNTLNHLGRIAFNPTSVQNLESNESLLLFPNPIQSSFRINREWKELHIFDMLGKMVLSTPTRDEIDVSSLARGMYMAQIDGEAVNFIKQ